MSHKLLTSVFIAVSSIVASGFSAFAEGGSEMLARAKSEYSRSLISLASSFDRLKGSATNSVILLSKNGEKRTIEYATQFCVDGVKRKMQSRIRDESPQKSGSIEEVYSTNGSDAFILHRATKQDPWMLARMGTYVKKSDMFDKKLAPYLCAPLYIDDVPATEVMASEGFMFTNATPIQRDNRQMIKLEFKVKPNPSIYFDSGYIILSPDERWVLLESECCLPNHKEQWFRRVVEYGDPIDGTPMPRRVTSSMFSGRDSRVIEFEGVQRAVTPENEFALTAYSLPEISRSARASHINSLFTWLIGLSVVFLLFSVILNRLENRRRHTL